MALRPPVEPMLAQADESVPGPAVLRAGVANEQNLDGHRAIVFTPAGPGGRVVVQARRGSLVQDRWPDLVAAAETQLPHGLVLDGELVVWDTSEARLSFEALQRRAAARARSAARSFPGGGPTWSRRRTMRRSTAEAGAGRRSASWLRQRELPSPEHVERCFSQLKGFRGIATRYEKTATSYEAAATLASILLWARSI
ncbi:ATP-dependent DNA ligase [Streptomyces sp. NPDC005180]|uniref:ATP-dependent DNA ligase n=1 Tax=Streptomyces sp. NPDC005180 TaxID=3156868 RepID=UPI0033B580B3